MRDDLPLDVRNVRPVRPRASASLIVIDRSDVEPRFLLVAGMMRMLSCRASLYFPVENSSAETQVYQQSHLVKRHSPI